ncbi:MAG TPA: nucleotidyltransferase domain-containing protein [Thermotogota bacterium]|nr:nucleotidyltransferase domain-containing protein [Thermotogota bacterium]HPJ89574.1 nucleotidyltransferase domain-containing protein [Thermotogota bacterium]HPR97081.1 nucleotidyltransferase domain-containing protein [Thermotogota bacterium]
MKFGLKEKTIKSINSVFKKYKQIDKVILYGSRALGTYKNGSDIDLTLVGKTLSFSSMTGIWNDLDDLLLPYTFDLSIFSELTNTDLIEHINENGIEFFVQKDKN